MTKMDTKDWILSLTIGYKPREDDEYVRCSNCAGSGRQMAYFGYNDDDESCNYCHGSGKILEGKIRESIPRLPFGLEQHMREALRTYDESFDKEESDAKWKCEDDKRLFEGMRKEAEEFRELQLRRLRQRFVGKRLDEVAELYGSELVRVIRTDSQYLPVSYDFVFNRLNVEVENDIVVAVTNLG